MFTASWSGCCLPVNETLRLKAMYRGDLSEMVIQSLDSVDLRAVPLAALKWGEEDYCGLTVQIRMKLRDRLIAASKQRNVSINSLINTALVHWLAEQGDVTVKGRTGQPAVISLIIGARQCCTRTTASHAVFLGRRGSPTVDGRS
jgi:hypothetical protein